MEKDSFVLYADYLEDIEPLSIEQRGYLLTAILCYASGQEVTNLDPVTTIVFRFIKKQMDRNDAKYKRIVEKRRAAGRKGGRPAKTNTFEKKQTEAKEANAFFEKQKNPVPDPVPDPVPVPDPDKRYKDNSFSNEKLSGTTDSEKDIFVTIRELYNFICGSYPRLTKMSDRRKKAIAARMRTGYTVEDFRRLFEKAEASAFLKGKNDRNWSATFDWLIADTNMPKVLEGNYDERKEKKQDVEPEPEGSLRLW